MIDSAARQAILNEAESAEVAAVYNLNKIRKLEKRLDESDTGAIGWIEAIQADLSSRWVPHLGDRILALEGIATALCVRAEAHEDAIAATSTLLDEERRKNVTLTRLVERMGRELKQHEHEHGWASQWDYTIIGQREYDEAMHEAGGAPPTRESEGAWGHE